MNTSKAALVLVILLILPLPTVLAEEPRPLPAFPGAEGFGATTPGGRGGRVIKVTNLNRSGPGSLAAACQAEGPRVVVFDVAGVIPGNVTITRGQLTIAGQTAPAPGITIEGILASKYRSEIPIHDVVIRFLRARPPRARRDWDGGDCLQITGVENLLIDHVSASWGSDENMDLCGSRNFTVQWCAIEESDTAGHVKGRHNFGMIMGYEGKDATVHHNLFAHHKRRAPLCGLELLDHRNNVIYNMQTGLYWHPADMNRSRPGKGFRANVVANYFQSGPDAPRTGRDLNFASIDVKDIEEIHAAGNVFTWIEGLVDPWKHPLRQGVFRAYPIRCQKPWPAPPVATHTANEAYELVLAQAGCLPRDAVSERTVREVRSGSGSWGRHDPPGGL
ncbi:MAG TPA: hypothetical protein VFJ30_13610, partial [Phycisphaerae bacterium]|nr:hypothetical protein [Phycisphaerae bacterium]